MIGDIKMGHLIFSVPEFEMAEIYAKFAVIESNTSKEEIENFYYRTRKFIEYITNEFDFEVTVSVVPNIVINNPSSNCWRVELMTTIPLSLNYKQEINEVEQGLKDQILRNYPKFY